MRTHLRSLSHILASSSTLFVQAQTGPGGVGNSANNVLWLRADMGVTTVGPAVTNWADQSGNGNNATSPSVAARPSHVASSLNGYPILTFDGVDDEMRIPDAASLDLNQWHMFVVGAETNPGSNNSWFTKGTSTQPNYGLWSPANGALIMPIYDILNNLNAPSAPAGTTDANFNVIEYSNRVLFILFPSRTLYKNATSVYTDASLLQLPANNGNQLYIGDTQDNTGWNLDGSIAEMIFYNGPLNAAQRIIVDNYLAAKYGRTLTSSDIYVQDNPANGNYDHDVAGIGRVNASNIHNDSRGSGIVQINAPSGLGNNEFLFWGHDNQPLDAWGVTDFPPSVQGRLARVWRPTEANSAGTAVDVGSVNMTWDLTGLGSVTAADLRLLVDSDNDGVFADETPIGPPTWVGGNLYRFTNLTALANNLRFTLATIDPVNTPLPIELVSFTAEAIGSDAVELEWTTASEHDNDHFTIERSSGTGDWIPVLQVDAVGTSTATNTYTAVDDRITHELVYYRLRQTDLDGTSTVSEVVAVRMPLPAVQPIVYPNPIDGPIVFVLPDGPESAMNFSLIDASGRVLPLNAQMLAPGRYLLDPGTLAPGAYVLRAQRPLSDEFYSVRILR